MRDVDLELSDAELDLFSRQLILPGFELEHQQRLKAARVLVVGCGGLGSPLALYLAAAGVGELVLADGDLVEPSNLHRQLLHGHEDVGRSKVESAAAMITQRYHACTTRTMEQQLSGEVLIQTVAAVDLVADGSDNYPTRFALNRACIKQGIPLVSAAAARLEGQLATFDSAAGGPCYRCLYPDEGAETALSCRENGVLGPVVGVIGSLQALEVIRVLTGWGENLRGRMLLMDLATHSQQILSIARRDNCPDCG